MPQEDNETPVPMSAQSLAPVPDEPREGPNYDADDNQEEHMSQEQDPNQVEISLAKVLHQGGTGQATVLAHPLPARVLDRTPEELAGDFELLDGIDEGNRRAT